MDLLKLDDQLHLLNTLGYTIPIDEKMKLKLAHIRLMNDNPDLDEVKYWGKIQGLAKNYYIMVGLKFRGSYQFPHKNFFWAQNDFEFKPLPELLLQHQALSAKFNSYFTGDPNKILENLQGEGEGEGEPPAEENPDGDGQKKQIDEEQEELKKVPKRNYTELHRLSHVVQAIQNDAQVIPQGSYKMTPQNELAPNQYFYGLNKKSALDLSFWHHFRAPQTQKGRKKIEADNVVFTNDFLDTLEGDLPKGVWSLQLSPKGECASCRNLTWPGYYSFHGVETCNFGSIYMGQGIKNIDLAFML